MSDKYDDIIDRPHYVSRKRTRMSNYERAAQFSSFAALTGYEDAVAEEGRLTDKKLEIDEERKAKLNDGIRMICQEINSLPCVRLSVFEADEKKAGGRYVSVKCKVRKIDLVNRLLIDCEGREVPLDDIYDISFEEEADN